MRVLLRQALHHAVIAGEVECIKLLMALPNIDVSCNEKRTYCAFERLCRELFFAWVQLNLQDNVRVDVSPSISLTWCRLSCAER